MAGHGVTNYCTTYWCVQRGALTYILVCCDYTSHASFSFLHADTKSESIVTVLSKLRSKVRTTRGEIAKVVSDPLSAAQSKTVADYAADESGHGKGFVLDIGAQGHGCARESGSV